MPKKAYLANYYSSEELKHKYLKSQDAVESRRWHLLWKISLGWTIKNSAIAVGINYDYAKVIVKKYNCLGAKGLENLKNKQPQQRGGKKALLTDEQLEKLRQLLVYLIPRVNTKWLNLVYESLALDAGISEKKRCC